MCGRYTITELPAEPELAESLLADNVFKPNYNVAPTNACPVIPQGDPDHIYLYRWGLIPHWAQDMKIGYRLINARSETLAEKSSFKNPLQRSRCLVLADGFYEWKKEGSDKQPYRITLNQGGIMTLAGLYDQWRSPEGETIYSFTIITTEPNSLMAGIHDRMPVILDGVAAKEWIQQGLPQEDALNMLRPYDADRMTAYPVSKAVGNVRNNDVSLIQPVS
jgi:putative SOS response-associated peptidase YedK